MSKFDTWLQEANQIQSSLEVFLLKTVNKIQNLTSQIESAKLEHRSCENSNSGDIRFINISGKLIVDMVQSLSSTPNPPKILLNLQPDPQTEEDRLVTIIATDGSVKLGRVGK